MDGLEVDTTEKTKYREGFKAGMESAKKAGLALGLLEYFLDY